MDNKEIGFLQMFENGCNIKIIGDSIAAGAGSSDSVKTKEVILDTCTKTFFRRTSLKSWSSLFQIYMLDKFPKCTVVNNGCGGITSTEVRENLSKLCSDEDELVIILLGCNDRKVLNGMNQLFDNLTFLIKFLKDRNKKIILMSPNPSTFQNESYPNRLYHMDHVTNVISCVAENENIHFINSFNYIQNYLFCTNKTIDEIMLEENCMNDGLHPTDSVHFLIFRSLIEGLNLALDNNISSNSNLNL